MYDPHDSLWLILGFVLCVVAFGVLTFQKRRGSIARVQGLPKALLVFGALLMVLAFGLRAFDRSKSLQALTAVVPTEVPRLVLRRERTTEITNRAEIVEFLTLLQTASSVAAHHSHPTDEFELNFDWHGKQFRYRLGRDSERFDEVWVRAAEDPAGQGSGREIGRVRSDKFVSMAEIWLRKSASH